MAHRGAHRAGTGTARGDVVTLELPLPEAHLRHVARMVLDGLNRLSDEAEDWVIEQGWFRRWVSEAATAMIADWILHHGWGADPPAAFWPDQPKDIPGAEEIAKNLLALQRTRY